MKNLLVITLIFSSFGFGNTDASYCMDKYYENMDLVILCMEQRGKPSISDFEKQIKRDLDDGKEKRKKDDNLFLSCELIDKGRTKLERYDNGYQAFDFGNTTLIKKKTIFRRVPDKEKFPIYLDFKNNNVSIEASGDLENSYSNVSFSGKLITETESSFYLEAERRWGEKWEININRNTGTIIIKPKGVIGILDAIERFDNDKLMRILEGYCEARPKRKF